MASPIPTKIVLKSTTKISLNDRFASIAKAPVVQQQTVRAKMAAAQMASAKNRRLAQQMANRPSVQQALGARLKKKSIQQRLGGGGQAGNGTPASQAQQVSVKQRLTLPPRLQRGRGRGARGQARGNLTQRLGMPQQRGQRGGARGRGMRGRGQVRGIRGAGNFDNRGRGYWGNRGRFGSQTTPRGRGRGAGQRGTPRGRGRFQRGGRRGQRGAARGRGGQQGKNVDQLNTELDQYMSQTKAHLDAELDAYMAEAN